MEESVVADFTGRVHTRDVGENEPVPGRILLSQRRLVLASDSARTTIGLKQVFDVAVGTVPSDLRSFFSDTITVAYVDGNAKRTAVIEGEPEPMDRFQRILFKTLLEGVSVRVRSPAKVGGRVVDGDVQTAAVSLGDGEIGFLDCEDPFTVDLSTVMDFDRGEHTIDGAPRPTLSITHTPETGAVTSLVSVPSERTLGVLGRFIKLEYAEVMEDVRDLDLTDEELEILVSLYSAGGEASISTIVTGDATQTSMVLETLRNGGLVADGETATALTPKGRMVVNTYLEKVNT
ncbi:CheF family chemotaxis protein [Haloparvum sp. AD34]